MELTFCLPVLVLIMIAAYGVGAAMYTGSSASTAVKEAVDDKVKYADASAPIDLLKMKINSYKSGTFQIAGNPVDTVNLLETDKKTVIVQATKSYSFGMLPTFTFVISSGLPASALRTNAGVFVTPTFVPYVITPPPAVNPAAALFNPATLPKKALISPIDCIPADADIAVDFATAAPVGGSLTDNAKALVKLYVDKAATTGILTCGKTANTNDVTFDATVPAY